MTLIVLVKSIRKRSVYARYEKNLNIQICFINMRFNIGGYLLNRGYWRGLVVLFTVFLLILTLSRNSYSIELTDDGVNVAVYIIALENVGTSAVDNVSRVVEGVQWAIDRLLREGYKYWWSEEEHLGTVNAGGNYTYWIGEEGRFGRNFAELLFPVNVTLHIVSDWSSYRTLIETAQGSIIVNVHGETLPIPEGYTEEVWIETIAQAMLHQNLTWVHVGGYPFYYYWYESSGLIEVGGQGFQELMGYISKGNVTCDSPSPSKKDDISFRACAPLFRGAWNGGNYLTVTRNFPLKEADFEGLLAMNIWGAYTYFPGAVIAFKEIENQSSFGFYVHIGTLKVIDSEGKLSDRDFWRAYVGSACGLWANIGRTVAEYKLAETEAVIAKAISEGRTEGLEDAEFLLYQAKLCYDGYLYTQGTISQTYNAIIKAENTQIPTYQPSTPLLLMTPIALGIVLGLLLRHRRKKGRNDLKKV